MKTLTLRNVPDEVVQQLAATAQETHQSMNGAAVMALRRALGLDAGPRRKRDLSAFAGQTVRLEQKTRYPWNGALQAATGEELKPEYFAKHLQ